MDILHAIERSTRSSLASGRFEPAFCLWKERHSVLACLADVAELIDKCRGVEADRAVKDAIYIALCAEATGDAPDDDARTLLAWLLLPGIWSMLREFECSESVRDDLAAEMLAGLWLAVTQVGPQSRAIAHNLLKGAQRAGLRFLRGDSRWSHVDRVDDRRLEGTAYPRPDDYDDTLCRAMARGVVSAVDLQLLLADGNDLRELAAAHQLDLKGAHKRRQNARERLRRFITESSRERTRR